MRARVCSVRVEERDRNIFLSCSGVIIFSHDKGWMEMYRMVTWRKMGEGHAFSISVKGRVYYYLDLVLGRFMSFVIDKMSIFLCVLE